MSQKPEEITGRIELFSSNPYCTHCGMKMQRVDNIKIHSGGLKDNCELHMFSCGGCRSAAAVINYPKIHRPLSEDLTPSQVNDRIAYLPVFKPITEEKEEKHLD